MKREYMKPVMRVVELQHHTQLLQASSPVRSLNSNFEDPEDEFILGGGNGPSR